jgi:hypothetical protein
LKIFVLILIFHLTAIPPCMAADKEAKNANTPDIFLSKIQRYDNQKQLDIVSRRLDHEFKEQSLSAFQLKLISHLNKVGGKDLGNKYFIRFLKELSAYKSPGQTNHLDILMNTLLPAIGSEDLASLFPLRIFELGKFIIGSESLTAETKITAINLISSELSKYGFFDHAKRLLTMSRGKDWIKKDSGHIIDIAYSYSLFRTGEMNRLRSFNESLLKLEDLMPLSRAQILLLYYASEDSDDDSGDLEQIFRKIEPLVAPYQILKDWLIHEKSLHLLYSGKYEAVEPLLNQMSSNYPGKKILHSKLTRVRRSSVAAPLLAELRSGLKRLDKRQFDAMFTHIEIIFLQLGAKNVALASKELESIKIFCADPTVKKNYCDPLTRLVDLYRSNLNPEAKSVLSVIEGLDPQFSLAKEVKLFLKYNNISAVK